MILLILLAILAIAAYAPAFWVKQVMAKHSDELPSLPGTGGQLARHLVQRFELEGIGVEETDEFRDHFDPKAGMVRLGPGNYHGKSLTAVAVAAHEVGHAIQFHRKEKVFELRSRYLPTAANLNRIGIGIIWSLPVVGFIFKSPLALAIIVGISLLFQLAGALAYLIILPEEWDASFNKALPILTDGDYVDDQQLPKVRLVLKAAALTYFAAALANVLNLGRWLLVLRR